MAVERRTCYFVGVKPYPKYLDWLRYACAWSLYFYGITKLTGHQLVVPEWVAQKPIGSLDGYTLTWYYFGYSHAYKYILGIIQVSSATLLLFRKTALLAAIVMLPIMVNIVLINIFYVIGPGAEILAIFISTSLLLLLWHEREAFRALFWMNQPTEARTANSVHWIVRSIVILYALGVLTISTVGAKTLQRFADSYQRQHDTPKQRKMPD
jgi:hypothetical protein